MRINQQVTTPLGVGLVYQAYAVLDTSGQPVIQGVVVRLKINEQTEKARKQDNCLTPAAVHNGLWVFPVDQLQ